MQMKFCVGLIISFLFTVSAFAEGGVDSSNFYFTKAKNFQEQRRWNDAENHYLKALGFNPKNFEIQESLGNYYLHLRKYSEAKLVFEKMHQLRPLDTMALSQLATLSYNLKKFPEAIQHLTELGKYSPSEFTDMRLGKAFIQTEDYGKANVAFMAALQKNPANGEASYQLAQSFAESNNYKKAIPYYQQAIASQPTKYMWVYELGMLYFGQANYENAIAYFEKAASLGMPKDLAYMENLGLAQINTKDYKKGIATLEELLVKKPDDPTIIYLMGQAYYQHEKYDKAREMWEKVFALDETNYRALYMTGMAWQKSGKIGKGREICDRAISLDPSLAKMKQEKFSF